jgi:anaerobic selenocysteine-containing dehydrogenase
VFGGRMVVFMNETDMQARGITEGDMVEIESLAEDGKQRVVGGFWAKPHSIPGRLDRRLLSGDQSVVASYRYANYATAATNAITRAARLSKSRSMRTRKPFPAVRSFPFIARLMT